MVWIALFTALHIIELWYVRSAVWVQVWVKDKAEGFVVGKVVKRNAAAAPVGFSVAQPVKTVDVILNGGIAVTVPES